MRVLLLLLVACSSQPAKVTSGGSGGLVVTEDTAITNYADFPPQHIDDPKLHGKVADLTSEADGERTRWTLAVEDSSNLRHSYWFEMPSKVDFAIATGTSVLVQSETVGGGPNATGHIAVTTEDKNELLLAIGMLPAGWKAAPGRALETNQGTHDFAVRVTEPGGAAVELVAQPWRKFELGGKSFVGSGNASKTDTPSTPPPDFVGAWTDFTIVRAR